MKKVFCINCGVELEVVKKAVNWNCNCCRKKTISNDSLPVYEGCYTHQKEQPQAERQDGTNEKITTAYQENQRVIVTRFDGSQYVLKLVELLEVKKRLTDREFHYLLELGVVVTCTHIYEIENDGYIQAHCLQSDKFCP